MKQRACRSEWCSWDLKVVGIFSSPEEEQKRLAGRLGLGLLFTEKREEIKEMSGFGSFTFSQFDPKTKNEMGF